MNIFPFLLMGASVLGGHPTAEADLVITNAAALFALSDDEVARGRAFKLSGTLTYYRMPFFILDDGTGRIPIILERSPDGPAVGDCVKIMSGTSRLDNAGVRIFQSSEFQTIGKAKLPPPKEVPLADLDKPFLPLQA